MTDRARKLTLLSGCGGGEPDEDIVRRLALRPRERIKLSLSARQ
jgi:hypothetical protein